jgi:hypothetical protein
MIILSFDLQVFQLQFEENTKSSIVCFHYAETISSVFALGLLTIPL